MNGEPGKACFGKFRFPSGAKPRGAVKATRALFIACVALDLNKVVEALTSGAIVFAEDRDFKRPIARFVRAWELSDRSKDPEPFIRVLCKAGATLSDLGHFEEPLLKRCIFSSWLPMRRAALKYGAPLNTNSYGGRPPLIEAVRARAGPAIEDYLAAGADPNCRDNCGNTSLHYLVFGMIRVDEGNPMSTLDCFRLLLSYGASENEKSDDGLTPLDEISYGQEEDHRALRVALAERDKAILLGLPKSSGRDLRQLQTRRL